MAVERQRGTARPGRSDTTGVGARSGPRTCAALSCRQGTRLAPPHADRVDNLALIGDSPGCHPRKNFPVGSLVLCGTSHHCTLQGSLEGALVHRFRANSRTTEALWTGRGFRASAWIRPQGGGGVLGPRDSQGRLGPREAGDPNILVLPGRGSLSRMLWTEPGATGQSRVRRKLWPAWGQRACEGSDCLGLRAKCRRHPRPWRGRAAPEGPSGQ